MRVLLGEFLEFSLFAFLGLHQLDTVNVAGNHDVGKGDSVANVELSTIGNQLLLQVSKDIGTGLGLQLVQEFSLASFVLLLEHDFNTGFNDFAQHFNNFISLRRLDGILAAQAVEAGAGPGNNKALNALDGLVVLHVVGFHHGQLARKAETFSFLGSPFFKAESHILEGKLGVVEDPSNGFSTTTAVEVVELSGEIANVMTMSGLVVAVSGLVVAVALGVAVSGLISASSLLVAGHCLGVL